MNAPDVHPTRPDEGATQERLPVWIGGLLALVVTVAGSLPSIAVAVSGQGLVWVYGGLGGILASGVAGLALAYRFPPADLALARPVAASASGRRR